MGANRASARNGWEQYNIRASRPFCLCLPPGFIQSTVTRPAEPPFPLQGHPIKAPCRRLFRSVLVVSFTGTSLPPSQQTTTPDSVSSNEMCFGGKGDTVVIRKRERPRYTRDYYVSRPETATYRRETVTRRSGSAHRPHDHHHHHHDQGRSRSRSRVTEERRSRTYYRD